MVQVTFPQCERTLKSAQDLSGKTIRCPVCQKRFSVTVQEEQLPPFAPLRKGLPTKCTNIAHNIQYPSHNIHGNPGDQWKNDTDKTWYQLKVNFSNSCGLCIQYANTDVYVS